MLDKIDELEKEIKKLKELEARLNFRIQAIEKVSENAKNKPWPDNEPRWREIISLYAQHLSCENLTEKDIYRMCELSELFNVLSNSDLTEVLKKYPTYPQDILIYFKQLK